MQFGLGFFQFLEYALGPCQVALAGFGQVQAPGGALQQPYLEVLFELHHQLGQLGAGQAQLLGGLGVTAQLGHPDKGLHGRQLVHGASSKGGGGASTKSGAARTCTASPKALKARA